MKLRRIIRYLEIIDRQLEILYINFSRCFRDNTKFAIFWKNLSLEKSNLFSCLSLIEQVGEENMDLSEYKEEEFICVMEKLTRYIKEAVQGNISLERAIEIAVEIETEHYVHILNHLTNLVEDDFKHVLKEMDHNKEYRNKLRRVVIDYYPEKENKKILIQKIEKSFQ